MSLSHRRGLTALQTIVTWIGSQANIFEKQKVREIASLIRDTDRHGKARIVDANEGEEPEEMLKVRTETLASAITVKKRSHINLECVLC